MRKWLAALQRLLDANLAQVEHATQSRNLRLFIRNLRITIHVGRSLVLGKHDERAASLTYSSLLALVPLLAVVFSLFKAFGGLARVETQVKGYLFGYLANESQGQVADWLDRFVHNFNAGAVGGVGMTALLITLILTLRRVEEALNRTWGVQSKRGWLMRLVVYWSLITFGPILLGSSLAVTATLQSTSAVRWAQQHVPLFGLQRQLLPMAFTALAFSAMYLILPATRVRWTAALTGGIAGGVVFEIAKSIYTIYTARVVSNHPLYGSLAALPFFFIWLNYSWRIVLFGADVAHAVQYVSTDPTEETDPRTCQATREEATIRICAAIAAAFAHNRLPPSTTDLTSHLLLPAHLTETLCQHLLKSGLVREVVIGRREVGFVPARSLEDLTAADVVKMLRTKVGVSHWAVASDARDEIERLIQQADHLALGKLGEMRWSDLARCDQPAIATLRAQQTEILPDRPEPTDSP